jgi:pimeloyl-ACP methyl ester carboxylesterase
MTSSEESSSLPFDVDEFVFDPRPNYPLVLTAKRYRLKKDHGEGVDVNDLNPDASTLIFAHGTGFHKEQWEPTIQDLWSGLLLSSSSRREGDGSRQSSSFAIREAWSLDCPNHGEAAVLNEETLQWGYEQVCEFSFVSPNFGTVFQKYVVNTSPTEVGWGEYARIIHLFLTGMGTGIPTDFSSHTLVGVGHSMGAISLILSLTYPSPPAYETLVLVEPMLMSQFYSRKFGNQLMEGALARRDLWPSKEEAFSAARQRKTFKVWDERVLRIFCVSSTRVPFSLL